MKKLFAFLPLLLLTGCDNVGVGGVYPSIYSKNSSECGCDGILFMIKNPHHTPQRITLVRTRHSGTGAKKRKEIELTIQPKIEKRLGCSKINIHISGRTDYCDTTQSFYVKKYREIKPKD